MGRDAYLNLGAGIGEDWEARKESVFSLIGDRGSVARTGEEDSGEGTAGRWSQALEKIGAGAKESIFSDF